MTVFAGSISFIGTFDNKDTTFQIFPITGKDSTSSIYLFGETNCISTQEIINLLKEKIKGEMLTHDISISTEDKIKVFPNISTKENYTLKALQGGDISFEEVESQFSQEKNIIAIREAEESTLFGNRVIKIDCIEI